VTEVQGGGSDLVRDPSGLRGSWARDADGLHRPVRNAAVHRGVQQRGRHREPLPTVLDSAEIVQEFGVSALETTVILDRDGEEVYRDVAVSDAETLRAELEGVL